MKLLQIFRAGLLNRIVYRIAAAFIHTDRMGHADSILQRNAVFLARTSAVREVRPFAYEGTVNAMLGMEHRHMLMNDDLQLGRICVPQQIDHLLNVQIVGRRHHIAARFKKQLNRLMVGNIQVRNRRSVAGTARSDAPLRSRK